MTDKGTWTACCNSNISFFCHWR